MTLIVRALGQAKKALSMLDNIMRKFPAQWGQNHQDVLTAKTFKANAHRDLGELKKAEQLHREVIKILEEGGRKEPMWNSMGDLALDLLALAEEQATCGNGTIGQILKVTNATFSPCDGTYLKIREDDDGRPMYEKEGDKTYVINFDRQRGRWILSTGRFVFNRPSWKLKIVMFTTTCLPIV